MFHSCLYERRVRSFEHKKCVLTTELHCPVRSFDEKIYVCDTCHKHLSRNEMPYQAVFSNMSVDPIQDKLKDFKKSGKILISKGIIFKKMAITHGKGEISKIKSIIVISPLKHQIYAIFFQGLPIQTD